MFHTLSNSVRQLFISTQQLELVQQKEIEKCDNEELEVIELEIRQLETKLKTDKRKEAFRNAILKKPKHLRDTFKQHILEKHKIKDEKDKVNEKKQADKKKEQVDKKKEQQILKICNGGGSIGYETTHFMPILTFL
jgi:hypothetical protein